MFLFCLTDESCPCFLPQIFTETHFCVSLISEWLCLGHLFFFFHETWVPACLAITFKKWQLKEYLGKYLGLGFKEVWCLQKVVFLTEKLTHMCFSFHKIWHWNIYKLARKAACEAFFGLSYQCVHALSLSIHEFPTKQAGSIKGSSTKSLWLKSSNESFWQIGLRIHRKRLIDDDAREVAKFNNKTLTKHTVS